MRTWNPALFTAAFGLVTLPLLPPMGLAALVIAFFLWRSYAGPAKRERQRKQMEDYAKIFKAF